MNNIEEHNNAQRLTVVKALGANKKVLQLKNAYNQFKELHDSNIVRNDENSSIYKSIVDSLKLRLKAIGNTILNVKLSHDEFILLTSDGLSELVITVCGNEDTFYPVCIEFSKELPATLFIKRFISDGITSKLFFKMTSEPMSYLIENKIIINKLVTDKYETLINPTDNMFNLSDCKIPGFFLRGQNKYILSSDDHSVLEQIRLCIEEEKDQITTSYDGCDHHITPIHIDDIS